MGAPDLVVEILSPGSLKREMRKFDEYEAAGVKEYWLVDYVQRSVQLFVLQNNKLVGQKPFAEEDRLQSVLFPELRIKLQEVFADIEDEDNYFSSSS
jgi:Uma2 family endonuclease